MLVSYRGWKTTEYSKQEEKKNEIKRIEKQQGPKIDKKSMKHSKQKFIN